MDELEKYLKNRNRAIKNIKNTYIKKYFGAIQVFHDCGVDKMEFNPHKSSLSIDMTIWHGRKKYGSYRVVFSNIFEINFKHEKEPDEVLELITFKNYFDMDFSFEFLYCFFEPSPYEKFSKKYLKRPAYRAKIFFLNSLVVTIDFNKIMVKGSLVRLDKFIRMGWYRVDSE